MTTMLRRTERRTARAKWKCRKSITFTTFAMLLLIGGIWRFLMIPLFHQSSVGTAVIYVFGYDDPESVNNLDYFLRTAIRAKDGAFYYLVLEPDFAADKSDLPALPDNVQVIVAAQRCFNLGTVGWLLLESGLVDTSHFKYFVWLDNSVRGPYLPVYLQDARARWHEQLTNKLNAETKLVGATISCAGLKLNVTHSTLIQPHVQGYLQATDREGLEILRRTKHVFTCHQRWIEAVRFGEIGASEAIIQAGFNIGSLMLRYAGVDFRNSDYSNCGRRMNPLLEDLYDGINLHPLEVMFVKYHHHSLVTGHPAVRAAQQYERWELALHDPLTINSNEFRRLAERHLAKAVAKGPKCFDAQLYISAAPAEFEGYTAERAWEHFIMFGHREGRPYRFVC